jgi:hypothetical protein
MFRAGVVQKMTGDYTAGTWALKALMKEEMRRKN